MIWPVLSKIVVVSFHRVEKSQEDLLSYYD